MPECWAAGRVDVLEHLEITCCWVPGCILEVGGPVSEAFSPAWLIAACFNRSCSASLVIRSWHHMDGMQWSPAGIPCICRVKSAAIGKPWKKPRCACLPLLTLSSLSQHNRCPGQIEEVEHFAARDRGEWENDWLLMLLAGRGGCGGVLGPGCAGV